MGRICSFGIIVGTTPPPVDIPINPPVLTFTPRKLTLTKPILRELTYTSDKTKEFEIPTYKIDALAIPVIELTRVITTHSINDYSSIADTPEPFKNIELSPIVVSDYELDTDYNYQLSQFVIVPLDVKFPSPPTVSLTTVPDIYSDKFADTEVVLETISDDFVEYLDEADPYNIFKREYNDPMDINEFMLISDKHISWSKTRYENYTSTYRNLYDVKHTINDYKKPDTMFDINVNRLVNKLLVDLVRDNLLLETKESQIQVKTKLMDTYVSRLETYLRLYSKLAQDMQQYNNEVIRVWAMVNNANVDQLKALARIISSNADIYNSVARVNESIRDLVTYYNSLIILSIEAEALNYELESLKAEYKTAVAVYKAMRAKEEALKSKTDYVRALQESAMARLEWLREMYDATNKEATAILAKIKAMNERLHASEMEVRADAINYNARAMEIPAKGNLQFMNVAIENYISLLREYYSLYRNYITSMLNSTRYADSVTRVSSVLYEMELRKLLELKKYHYDHLTEAYGHFLSLHSKASNMIASAEIEIALAESYS